MCLEIDPAFVRNLIALTLAAAVALAPIATLGLLMHRDTDFTRRPEVPWSFTLKWIALLWALAIVAGAMLLTMAGKTP